MATQPEGFVILGYATEDQAIEVARKLKAHDPAKHGILHVGIEDIDGSPLSEPEPSPITHVKFDGCFVLDNPVPADATKAEIAQALQNEMGHTGICFSNVRPDDNCAAPLVPISTSSPDSAPAS